MTLHLAFLIGIILLLAASAFFSGVEMAFVSVNKIRLKHLADIGHPKARLVHSLQERTEEVLTAILIGNNITVVAATALFTRLVYPLGLWQAEWLSTLVMTPLVLVFAEIIPKVIFRHQANQLIFILVSPLYVFFKLVRPVAVTLLRLVEVPLTGFFPAKAKNPFVSKEELRYLIEEGEKEGFLESHEKRIIERIFDFGAITVKEVMTRRSHIVSISEKASMKEAKEFFRRKGFTRLPVEGQTPGAYVGILHILDCLFEKKELPARSLTRELVAVDEDMVVQKALIELRVRKQRMALVRNSTGETVGLVTVQDLIAI